MNSSFRITVWTFILHRAVALNNLVPFCWTLLKRQKAKLTKWNWLLFFRTAIIFTNSNQAELKMAVTWLIIMENSECYSFMKWNYSLEATANFSQSSQMFFHQTLKKKIGTLVNAVCVCEWLNFLSQYTTASGEIYFPFSLHSSSCIMD